MTSGLAPVRRRVRRFFSALRPRVTAAERAGLAAYLSPPQLRLFESMQPADQRHSLDVLASLLRDGHRDPDLLQAAILHDAGKARARLTVWHRVVVDLSHSLSPSALGWLASHGPPRLRHSFDVALRHQELGAADALAAGCSSRVAGLIRGDATPDLRDLVATLQRYDAAN